MNIINLLPRPISQQIYLSTRLNHYGQPYSYVSCRILLTLSSTATFLDFQTNSQTAITQATPIPPIKTTKTPPTLARPSSFAVLLVFVVSSYFKRVVDGSFNGFILIMLTLHEPPPRFSFHQRVFKICSFPSSWSLSIAPLIAVRNGESEKLFCNICSSFTTKNS